MRRPQLAHGFELLRKEPSSQVEGRHFLFLFRGALRGMAAPMVSNARSGIVWRMYSAISGPSASTVGGAAHRYWCLSLARGISRISPASLRRFNTVWMTARSLE